MNARDSILTKKMGERLRGARAAQSLSLSELSVRTDGVLSKSRISNYEQGIRRIGIEEAQILSHALGTVSAAFLLCVDETGALDNSERRLVSLYRMMKPAKRRALLEFARTSC